MSYYNNSDNIRNTYYQNLQQQRPQMTNSGSMLKGRPVASVDEARATIIDFDGSIFYFPDHANKRIYTKQINMDGTSSFRVYEEVTPPDPINNGSFVTKDEFKNAVNVLVQEIEKLKEVGINNVLSEPKPVESKSEQRSNPETVF